LSVVVGTPVAADGVHPVIRWLMTDARRRVDASEFLEAFALKLRAAGVDVARITTGVPAQAIRHFRRSAPRRLYRLYRAFGAFRRRQFQGAVVRHKASRRFRPR
jgi:hypothetical protein